MCIKMRIRLPTIYTHAIKGTSFSTTDASLDVPPININAATTAITIPTARGGILTFLAWNTDENAAPMEFDCTILPINQMCIRDRDL